MSTAGEIKDICDAILSASNLYASSLGSSLNRTSAEYYRYGSATFGDVVGSTPQLRLRPTSFETTYPEKASSFETTGSIATMLLNMEGMIWADSEHACLAEFSLFTKAFGQIGSSINGITQPPPYPTINGDWTAVKVAHKGKLLAFDFQLKVSIPEPDYFRNYIELTSINLSSSFDNAEFKVTEI